MNPHRMNGIGMIAVLCACVSLVRADAQAPAPSDNKEIPVTLRATGTFEVKLTPQPDDSPVGRMIIDKKFHGDLEATSKGQMLAYTSPFKGSAGYVAIERVDGALKERKGTFALQHTGTMARGNASLSVTVIPDSGTGDLKGLTGRMDIIVEGGKHSYEFNYSFDEAAK